jgi:hypothetical protein
MGHPWSDGPPGNLSQKLHNSHHTDLSHCRLLVRSFGQLYAESHVLNLGQWCSPLQPWRWWSSFVVSNVSLRTRPLLQRVNEMIATMFGLHRWDDLQLQTWPLSALAIDRAIEVVSGTSAAEQGRSVTRRPHRQHHPPLHQLLQESLDRAQILRKMRTRRLPMPQQW